MLWTWIAVGAAVWLFGAVTVGFVVAKAISIRDERERPRPRVPRPTTSSRHHDRVNSA